MNYHCRNYLCKLLTGCVCECDECYRAKGLVDEVCPACGWCPTCGRKNEPAPVPIIYPQIPWSPTPYQPIPYTPDPVTPNWPQGPIWTIPGTITVTPAGTIITNGTISNELLDQNITNWTLPMMLQLSTKG